MKLGLVLGFVGIILLSVMGLYFFGEGITGNVVWEPSIALDNCSDAQMIAAWEDAFVRDSGSVTLLPSEDNWNEGCDRSMFEINGSEMWIGMVEESNYSSTWSTTRQGKKYHKMNGSSMTFYYFNATYNISLVHATPTTNDELDVFLWVFSAFNLNDWNLTHADNASTRFEEIFEVSYSDWVANYYFYETYGFENETSTDASDYSPTGTIIVNDSASILWWQVENYKEIFPPTKIIDLPDFLFQKNSGWSNATNLSKYFNLAESYDIYSWGYSLGPSNFGGTLVNISIVDGQMRFKPSVNYTGQVNSVRIEAENSDGSASSNYFLVTINGTASVVSNNTAPVFNGTIGNMSLKVSDTATINLSKYFTDPDGDALTYSHTLMDAVNVTINGSTMVVRVNASFVGTEYFFVSAFDGTDSTMSNLIRVSLKEAPVFLDPEEEEEPDPGEGGVLDSLLGGSDNTNSSGSSGSEGGFGKEGIWVMIIAGAILVCLILAAGIYFAFFNRSPVQAPIQAPGQAPMDPVNAYLKDLNLDKPAPRG
jgi:hypothetical protein